MNKNARPRARATENAEDARVPAHLQDPHQASHGPVAFPKILARDINASPSPSRPLTTANTRNPSNCHPLPNFAKYRSNPNAAHRCTSRRGAFAAFGE